MVCRILFTRQCIQILCDFLAPMNLQLAQKHYHSRFLELRDLIMAEELKFKLVQ